MKTFQALLTNTCLVGAFALTAWCVVLVWRRQIALFATRLLEKWSRLGNFGRVLLVTFVSAMIVYGSTKTNAPPLMGSAPMLGVGHAQHEVPQPAEGCVPVGATLAQDWWRTGGWESWRTVRFDDGWCFPHGDGHLTKVTVMSQGSLRTCVGDVDEIVSLGVPLAMVPFDTVFTHEHTSSNSYVFTWANAYANRDTNAAVNASIELNRNGDICVTTNGVETFIPRELPFPHVGIGQNDDWVSANFTNATEILSVGYANWVDMQIGHNVTNGLYKLTAAVADEPPETFLLTVGGQSVAIAHAGEYVFLLEKGEEYPIDTWPKGADVEFGMADDVDPYGPMLTYWWGGWYGCEWTVDGGQSGIVYPTFSSAGRVWWMPTFCGSPDVTHFGLGSVSKTFTAVLSDYRYAEAVAYHWSCEDGNVVIASPDSKETRITIMSMPSWREATLTVTATVGTNELCSTLEGFTYGTNDTPQVYFSFSAPDAVLLNSNKADRAKLRQMSLSLSSDAARSGQVRLSCVRGGDKVAVWGSSNKTSRISFPRTWDAAEFSYMEAYVEGVGTSGWLDDVEFKAEYLPDDDDAYEITRDLTVVEIGEVSLPGAPDDGLVVLRGTSVIFEVDCSPSGAESLVSTLWETRRLRLDLTSYDDWLIATSSSGDNETTYTPAYGGIYQVRVKAGVGGDAVDERYFRWAEDELISIGFKRRGDLKSFGVVSHVWQRTLRDCAKGFLGSVDYLATANLQGQYGFSPCPPGNHKCNYFVAYRIVQSGLACPGMRGIINSYPPVANDWGIATREIEGWEPLEAGCYPEPGFIIGEPDTEGEAPHGHVGILDFDGCGINAGTMNVNRKFMPRVDVFCIRKMEE